MEFESGQMAGTGSFRCTTCGFGVALTNDDALPECAGCGNRRFERAPMFGATMEVGAPEVSGEPPEWLDQIRRETGKVGDYIAFADGDEINIVTLPPGWTRIGRSLSAEVRIDDPTVSRRHALIHRDGTTVRLLDDRSLNGVFRNGRRVQLDKLSDGDTISVGRFELYFLHVAEDRETALA